MSELTREELWRQIKGGIMAPVYVLTGPETFLRDRAAAHIAERAFGPNDLKDFNQTEFSLYLKGNIESAIAAARQLPMMSARRVVRVADVRISTTAARDTLKEEYEELIGEYLSHPTETSVLILLADEVNGNRKITRLMKKGAITVQFKRLEGAELTRWIRKSVSEAGCEIDDSGLTQLTETVGTDLRRLTNEINKLAAASLPTKRIDRGLVEGLSVHASDMENFILTSALIAGRTHGALLILKRTLDRGTEPLALLGVLSYGMRRLLTAKEMMARGDDRRVVSAALRLRGRDEEPFLAAARRADRRKLMGVFEKLKRADLEIKTSVGGSGPRGARLQIEMLVSEIARDIGEPSIQAQHPMHG